MKANSIDQEWLRAQRDEYGKLGYARDAVCLLFEECHHVLEETDETYSNVDLATLPADLKLRLGRLAAAARILGLTTDGCGWLAEDEDYRVLGVIEDDAEAV